MTNNLLTNIIVANEQDTIANNTDVIINASEDDPISIEEKNFYSKLNSYKQSLKFPDKVMISFDYYKQIIHCLNQPKSGKAVGIDAKFHFWCKKHFKLDITSGVEIICSAKNSRRLVIVESYYSILREIHQHTGHGARDKMRYEVNQHYCWLPSTVIDLFLQCCTSCMIRKNVKATVTPTAIISIGFLTRLQIDLIDFRTRPDKEFKWILHCQDHYSKYSWGYPLISKEAEPIANYLLQLFYQFGPCKILQSDNGREFTAVIIKNLQNVWPGLVIINGRPRHPQSQGLVERGNATLCQVLGKFMEDQNTTSWTKCLLPALYSMNTSLARGVQMAPYEVVFGQKPRADYELWKLIGEQSKEYFFSFQNK
jgi:transposase InsO family protein